MGKPAVFRSRGCGDLLAIEKIAQSSDDWNARARAGGYDWITLGALFIAVCVLLMGTLYVNKQGRIRVSGMEASDFALQSAIAQSFALGHNFPPESPYIPANQFIMIFFSIFRPAIWNFLG